MRLQPPSTLARAIPVGLLSVALGAAATVAAVGDPGVSPQHYTDALAPGGSVTITKTVETPPIPPNPDIVFLADTTTSMTASIGNVQANATSIVDQILAAQPSAQFAVADYKDTDDATGYFLLRQQLTGDTTAVTNGIGAWTPLSGGGDDAAEDWIGALAQVPGAIDFRAGGTPIVVMFGDSTSHDPSDGHTLVSATAALQAAGIRVIAISVPGADGYLWNGLNSAMQASYVTSQTGGTLTNADPDEVSDVILSQLQNLPAEVTHEVSCDPGVSATLTPASQTVTSGQSTTFEETITLAADAPQGETVSCTVSFKVNGMVPGPEFVQTIDIDVEDVTPPVVTVESKTVEATSPAGAVVEYDASAVDNVDGPLTPTCVPPSGSQFALGVTPVDCQATDAAGNTGHGSGTIEVVDTTPPSVACAESTNPGGNVPKAGDTRPNPQGQNQDGFYRLDATDIVDTDPDVYLRDTGSGHVWGPFASGQRIKYTEAASGPSQKQLGDSDIVHLTGTGDAELYAEDFSGNVSAPVACLVPAPPM
ncbi:HYR domain-containing protein [Nocardioides albidus]|uniref:HYR domain-containing protein n=1 Tax=Nocardioides albidus TaxID=1517589 RepID=A0A5C4WM53_9ACTN|nr:vWA domain-containing protein [Nocardioides albidus]TNM48319.1 HYR domain-containing protein [Nocardioides albidus]